MENLSNKYKAQQAEYNDFILNNLITIADGFLSKGSAEIMTQLEKLEYVVLLDPHNIRAADALSATLEKTLLLSAVGKFSGIFKEEVQKRFKHMKEISDSDGFNESKSDITTGPEVKALQTQNENLRATVTQLRQKLAQVTLSTSLHPFIY